MESSVVWSGSILHEQLVGTLSGKSQASVVGSHAALLDKSQLPARESDE